MMVRHRSMTLLLGMAFWGMGGMAQAQIPEVFPGTQRWENRGDPAKAMVEGLHRYFDRITADSVARRAERWKRDLSSGEAYSRSVEPQREHLRRIIGSEPTLAKPVRLEVISEAGRDLQLAQGHGWTARHARWSVYDDVNAEGLWLEPKGKIRGCVVALPDADQTAEQFAGIAPGIDERAQIPRLLAEEGIRVLIPTLLSRSDRASGNPAIRMTNLSHREWVYRQAFEVGRHPIGYEVDMVRAAVEWLDAAYIGQRPIGIVGQGEGAAIALHAAALDTRIQATWIGGYFSPREDVWQEPIDRNVWGFLEEFGGAELASLVAPRALIVEACRGPEVSGPRPPRNGRADAASGRLISPDVAAVKHEFDRLTSFVGAISGLLEPPAVLVGDGGAVNQSGKPLSKFLERLRVAPLAQPIPSSDVMHGPLDPEVREDRMLRSWVAHTQQLIRTSELRRYAYWAKADETSPKSWSATVEPYRRKFWEDLIGKLPAPRQPMNPRSIKILDEPRWTGYAIQLDMERDLVASGVLLLPKDLKPGERRPVVVCQHGLEGTPDPIIDPKNKSVYNSYGAQLADRGYIVYAPQNPYIGHDRFRQLQRKANPLKQSLFSVIVRQHERTLEWLSALPQVDPKKIAFYGLSYGGKTAMRVPAILKDYCLSICSADFNEWVVKTTNLDRSYSYLYTVEYDMYEFGLGEMANYAEMAALISPRPFMVERGHKDGVAPDEWIGYEFAKVRRHYDYLGLGDLAEIAYFNDGHQIDGRGTFAFLAKHLNWPRGAKAP